MSYCANCGKQINDENIRCPNCGYKPVIEGEVINETSEIINENNESEGNRPALNKSPQSGGYNYGNAANNNTGGGSLSTLAKVLIVIGTIFLPGVGPIFGIISGIILMGDARPDYKSFGKSALALGIVFLVLSFVCCVFRVIFLGMFSLL